MQKACILLLALVALSSAEHLGKNAQGIDIFKIDISLEPKYRFNETVTHFKKPLIVALQSYFALVPDYLLDVVGVIGKAIHWVHPEYYEEVDGMAYSLGIDTSAMMFMQYLYEFTAFCTSTVVRMEDGSIVHNRNLDFAFAP